MKEYVTHLEIACANATCDKFMKKKVIKAPPGPYYELPSCTCGSIMYMLKEIKDDKNSGD